MHTYMHTYIKRHEHTCTQEHTYCARAYSYQPRFIPVLECSVL